MVEQDGDGNCLFRAVALQVYGDASSHGEVRRRCLDYMADDEEHFGQFVPGEAFGDYVSRKRRDGAYGNNPEIQAVSELYNRPVEVYVPANGADPINIFHAEYGGSGPTDCPIRLSYHDGEHYNAVVDPLLPTAGLGLGLPGLEPGLADRMQLERAKEMSDRSYLDLAVRESRTEHSLMYEKRAYALSDLDAADFDLEQAVLEQSLRSYRSEQGRKKPPRPGRRDRDWDDNPPPTPADAPYWDGPARGGTAGPAAAAAAAATAASPAPWQEARQGTASRATAAAAVAAAAPAPAPPPASASASASASADGDGDGRDEYPQAVQELVMNGFELRRVLKAYDLIGDNFDSLLCFLMSNAGAG